MDNNTPNTPNGLRPDEFRLDSFGLPYFVCSTNGKNFPLAFVYALEEAYKKDNCGFDNVLAFSAHTIAAIIEKALLDKTKRRDNSVEYMVRAISEPLMRFSPLDDDYFDGYASVIDEHAAEIVKAHPEILQDELEKHWFE